MLVSSFGVLLHEIISGERPDSRVSPAPFRCDALSTLAMPPGGCAFLCMVEEGLDAHFTNTFQAKMVHGLVLRVPEDCPQAIADLWQACTAVDPTARPSAASVQAALESMQSTPQPALPLLTQSAHEPAYTRASPNAAESHAGLAGLVGVLRTDPQTFKHAVGLSASLPSGSGAQRASMHDTAYAPRTRNEADELLDTVRAWPGTFEFNHCLWRRAVSYCRMHKT